MAAGLTFIIPVRHQDNSKNWASLKSNLTQTIRSVAAQTSDAWRAVIVANHGADLPELPPHFEVVRVDFPPNPLHEQGNADREVFLETFRLDKGRRVLSGMLHTRDTGHFMIVDDDDFVSRNMAAFVANNPKANGWYIQDGYMWGDGGKWLYRHPSFSDFCGTSHILRADLYHLPDRFAEADWERVKLFMGSHIRIKSTLEKEGTPLARLPMPGAVYRIGHAGSFIKSEGLAHQYFIKRELLRSPIELIRRIKRLQFLSTGIQQEFFGG